MKTAKQKKFALVGALFGTIYLVLNNVFPTVPELLLGLLIGLAMVCLLLGLLPKGAWRTVRKWKNRGE